MPPFVDPSDVSCPACSATNPVEIVYGLPSDEMHDAAARGDIALGGSVIDDAAPIYQCRECGNSFGDLPA